MYEVFVEEDFEASMHFMYCRFEIFFQRRVRSPNRISATRCYRIPPSRSQMASLFFGDQMQWRTLPVSLLSPSPALLQRRLPPLTRRWTAPKKSHRWQLCPRAESEESVEDALEVEEIDREYCNDFVCTSSPSVEETIKTFAVDLQRPGRWTMTRFPGDVIYKATSPHCSHSPFSHRRAMQDPLRSFRGKEKYERMNWIAESVDRPRVVCAVFDEQVCDLCDA